MGAIVVGEGACGVGKCAVDISLAVVLQSPLESDSRGCDEVQRDGEVVVIEKGGMDWCACWVRREGAPAAESG